MLKKLRFKKILYPTILIFFALVNIWFFIKTASFLSAKINDSFTIDKLEVQSQLITLDAEAFKALTDKLGITLNSE